jgi:hypothetical protein
MTLTLVQSPGQLHVPLRYGTTIRAGWMSHDRRPGGVHCPNSKRGEQHAWVVAAVDPASVSLTALIEWRRQGNDVRVSVCLTTWFSISAIAIAFAQGSAVRIENPKVQGENVDHCSDIETSNDCSSRGQAKAASQTCIAYGYTDQVDSHWHASSGPAEHYISQYDMHAGEVAGRWESRPSTGVFDWVACKK